MTGPAQFVVAIDQGTTSTRCGLVDRRGRITAISQRDHRQIFPNPGWVEHDAAEILSNTESVVRSCLEQANVDASAIAALGITNQRETTVAWDESGRDLAPAIVWQDTRTAALCARLAGDAGPDRFRGITGLPLATYFSGPKMRWLLDEVESVQNAAAEGRLHLGTVDSGLVWNLTGHHVTDVTNASRTMLMDLQAAEWSSEMLDAFDVPLSALPRLVPSIGVVAEVNAGPLKGVPVAGLLGDQQAALFGHGCFAPGEAKTTYGTGCFLLANTGDAPVDSQHGLISTIANRQETEPAQYALEGSVAAAGAAVQRLRDNLGMIAASADVEALASSVDDNADVYVVPAFSGLFAPHWRADARGVIVGLTSYSRSAHIARAVLESVAYQARDVVEAMELDAGLHFEAMKVDGGMVGNDLLMQFQADVLQVPVLRPTSREVTLLGAAYAAGIGVGFWDGFDEVKSLWALEQRFDPGIDEGERLALLSGWGKAVERSLGWVEDPA